MALLSQKVRMHDVDDTEAFVRAAIRDGRVRLSPDEFEELLAEGLQIMVRLARAYEPGRNGLDPSLSRFSGYAAKYLRVKLGDAYHRMQENHRLVTDEDGKRQWVYEDKPMSLNELTGHRGVSGVDPDPADHVKALQVEEPHDDDMATRLRQALEERWVYDRETTVKFGVLLGSGFAAGECARRLGIDGKEAAACFDRIRRIAHDLG